jgi:DNA-binding NtrC family response regulator
MRALLAQALESEGCTAIGVEDCAKASELAKLDPPDVIVTDERVIDAAPDAFAAMRDRFPKVVVVAMTVPVRHRKAVVRAGVDCEVEKPVEDEQLLLAVHWALKLADPDSPEGSA